MNIINNRSVKTIVLIIAFICPFLLVCASIYTTVAWKTGDGLKQSLLMQCVIILLWAFTTYASILSGITNNNICKRILLSGNLFVAMVLSIFIMPFGLSMPAPLILSWCAFIYIRKGKPTFNVFNFTSIVILMFTPWVLLILVPIFMFLADEEDVFIFITKIYYLFAVLYIFSVYFSVKRNLNIYSYGILTINQIAVWLSVIITFLSIIFIFTSNRNDMREPFFLILTGFILYGSMVYMNGATYFWKVKRVVNTVFGEGSFTHDGFNSITNLVMTSNGTKGKCFVFNRDTGTFLIISLNENKVIGFDYSDFAAAETDSGEIGSIRMTLRFYDRNNPEFSILSGAVPKAIQYIGDVYPANPTSGFREHVKRVLNAKFPKNKWQMD